MPVKRGTMAEANASTVDHGWVVGPFITGLGYTDGHEVKLWNYPGQPVYGKKTYDGPELIFIFRGVIRLILGAEGEEVQELRGDTHEFIILEPNTIKEVVVVEAPASGVTVRWPDKTI